MSLKSRRDLSCLLFFFKIINNSFDIIEIHNCIEIAVPNRSLRHKYLFKNVFTKYNHVNNFSLFKFYKIFNGFSEELDVFYMSFNIFKSKCIEILKE